MIILDFGLYLLITIHLWIKKWPWNMLHYSQLNFYTVNKYCFLSKHFFNIPKFLTLLMTLYVTYLLVDKLRLKKYNSLISNQAKYYNFVNKLLLVNMDWTFSATEFINNSQYSIWIHFLDSVFRVQKY